MKYKVNDEGVSALNAMSNALIAASEEISAHVNSLRQMMDEYSSCIGPHQDSLNDGLDSIAEIISNDSDAVLSVSSKLKDLAKEYQTIIDNDPFAPSSMRRGNVSWFQSAVSGGGNAKSGQNGSVAKSNHTLESVQGWISSINPNYDKYDYTSPYSQNCGSCALAVYNNLNGSQNSVASANTLSIAEMESLTGKTQVTMSPEQIKSTLLSSGPGSHAIIGIDRAEGQGHWFNAFTPDGINVYTLDGQNGTISGWPPDYGNTVSWDMSL